MIYFHLINSTTFPFHRLRIEKKVILFSSVALTNFIVISPYFLPSIRKQHPLITIIITSNVQ
ncbi:uncharacterized protein DS421_4g111870 [Arachis hypogaea]|nr:uncharacterized protein DS421_4g111870 [Arachis hypogaea]